MLSDAPTAGKTQSSWLARCETLEALAHELRRFAVNALLISDQATPYVRVHLSGTAGDRVTLSLRDGQEVYEWSSTQGQHPTMDPAGAARRMATQLGRERRLGGM